MVKQFTEYITIGEIADVRGGKRLPKGMLVQNDSTNHPYLRVVDFSDGGLNRSNIKFIDEIAYNKIKRYTISSDDVYISIAGTIGRVGIIPIDLSGANLTENAAKITNINSRIDKYFLMYYLRSNLGQSEIASKIVGTSQPKLALFRIQELRIPKLPPPTQKKIAAILSAYDDLIENNLRRIKILEEMAQNLYREWFVNFRFPGHEQTRFVDSPLGRIPEGWGVVPFTEVADVLSGGTPKTSVSDYWGGHIPFFAPKDTPSFFYVTETEKTITELGLKKCNSQLYPPESVFITARGTVGKLVLTDSEMAMNQSCYALKGKPGISQKYLFFTTLEQVEYLKKNTGGATFDTIVVDTFHRMQVMKPTVELITKFTKTVDPFMGHILNLINKNKLLSRTRDLLLPKLISGELDVSILEIALPEGVAI